MNPQRVVVGAWLAMLALATARSLGGGRGLPQPNVYLGSAVLFTILYGAAGFLGAFPAVIAVGTDVAAVLLPYVQGGKVGPLDQVAAGLDKIAGGPPPGGPAPGTVGP